jgi:hypothetical protein
MGQLVDPDKDLESGSRQAKIENCKQERVKIKTFHV